MRQSLRRADVPTATTPLLRRSMGERSAYGSLQTEQSEAFQIHRQLEEAFQSFKDEFGLTLNFTCGCGVIANRYGTVEEDKHADYNEPVDPPIPPLQRHLTLSQRNLGSRAYLPEIVIDT